MQTTPNLGLKKPDLNDYVSVADLNENADILDVAVSELQDGSAIIPDLETANKTLAGGINEVKSGLTTHLADYLSHTGYAVATGSANAYVATLTPALSEYKEGVSLRLKINTANTGAATVNMNGLGAKAIKKQNGNALTAGTLKAGLIYTLVYDGVSFLQQGEGGEYGNVTSADVLEGKTFGSDDGLKVGTKPLRQPKITQQFSVSGSYTYTVPEGVYRLLAVVVGGGGGGGGGTTNNTGADTGGGGGGAGGYVITNIDVYPGEVLNITVGTGGYGGAFGTGTSPGGNGADGGLSSVYQPTGVLTGYGGNKGWGGQVNNKAPGNGGPGGQFSGGDGGAGATGMQGKEYNLGQYGGVGAQGLMTSIGTNGGSGGNGGSKGFAGSAGKSGFVRLTT